MIDDDRLVRLAAEISDGAPIDWRLIRAAAASDDERALVAEMELLERLVDVHSHAALVPGSASRLTSDAAEPACLPPPPSWGPLRLMDRIGGGAFGDVYRAWDTRLDREVALKLLRPARLLGPSTETLPEASIIEEGRLLARVRHPGVVTVHGAERVDGRLGVWMELIEGRTLADEVAERGPLPAPEIQEIGVHLAEALDAVHHAGVLHRDVKAQNVMRDAMGRTVLMDFGTGLERADESGSLAGTPLYLAPEILAGGPATREGDVYSLGVLLYYLATGGFPVEGHTLGEVRRAHVRGERRPLRERRPDLPAGMAAAIDRALAPDAADRFADAAALAVALRAATGAAGRPHAVAVLAVTGVVIALLGIAAIWSVRSPAAIPSLEGITETQIDPDLQVRAAIRGPAINGYLIPCAPRATSGVALCDLRDGSIKVLRLPATKTELSPAARAVLSPNARRLAYIWYEGVGGPPEQVRNTVNLISPDGTAPVEIYTTKLPLQILRWASNEALLVREFGDSEERLLRIHSDGAGEKLLAIPHPDWISDLSIDGRTVLVTRRLDNQHDVLALEVGSGAERWSLSGPTNDSGALWTPDGRGVVFITDRSGCESVAYLPVDGDQPAGGVTILKDLGRNRASPMGFSPDGTYLLSLSHARRTAFVTPWPAPERTGQAPRSVASRCTDDSIGADWDPSGQRVAFLSGRLASAERARVVIQSRDGRVEREITTPGYFHMWGRVRWSPDGHLLGVLTAGGGRDELHILDLRTGEFQLVASSSGERGVGDALREARWHPDAAALFYRQGATINRFDTRTALTSVVHRQDGQGFSSFDIARSDGSLLVAHHEPSSAECIIRIVAPDGKAVERQRMPGECFGHAWTPDGSAILVSVTHKLWTLDRSVGPPTPVPIESDAFWDFSFSPDGQSLLFSGGNPMPNMVILKGIGRAR